VQPSPHRQSVPQVQPSLHSHVVAVAEASLHVHVSPQVHPSQVQVGEQVVGVGVVVLVMLMAPASG
jgi:hypothetical protein